MQIPLEISYRDIEPSAAMDVAVRAKAAWLERFFPRIVGCHVTIERPGQHHHRHGKGAHFRVRIELAVPGGLLVVGRDPARAKTHEDAYLAIHEAFRAMRRQLQDHVRKLRGDVKTHVGPARARVATLFRERGYGFLATEEGREIYFHRASVLGDAFDRLEVGDEVRFVEEVGDEGPQASTVERPGAPAGSL
ncbi:MAG: HPF/RaiA family ribosome-associated protein [Myxococcota bacterium]